MQRIKQSKKYSQRGGCGLCYLILDIKEFEKTFERDEIIEF